METILDLIGQLVTFTIGLIVVLFWAGVIIFVIDELIDWIIQFRNTSKENDS